jgi:lipopolysaccharide/colanic/teichoic acid biosynthesis glycosyltransferase
LLPDAERLGAFGRFLRRTSLDEIPQLLSVLTGDMSLIGPRPLPVRYVSRYNSRQSLRLDVRPGLTGLAQIRGRNGLDWPARLELDVRYVEMLSRWYAPLLDAWILVATFGVVFWQGLTGRGISGKGAVTMQEFEP